MTEIPKQRTDTQNRSLWLWFTLLADALNDAGLDMRKVLKPSYNLSWNKDMIHKHIWIPIQEAMFGTNSTTFLHKQNQIDKIRDLIMRELGQKFGVEDIAFPLDVDRALDKANKIDMPKLK